MNVIEKISIATVVISSLSLFILVPENPIMHLDDPSYWGVIGYCTVFLTIALLRLAYALETVHERIILTLFLSAMPLIYIADWIRFDGSTKWIYFELIGFLIYGTVAYLSTKKHFYLLGLGIAAHGLWDLLHINQNLYVPNWYALACAIVDCAVGFYVFIRFRKKYPCFI